MPQGTNKISDSSNAVLVNYIGNGGVKLLY
jgi:hypothetical protein